MPPRGRRCLPGGAGPGRWRRWLWPIKVRGSSLPRGLPIGMFRRNGTSLMGRLTPSRRATAVLSESIVTKHIFPDGGHWHIAASRGGNSPFLAEDLGIQTWVDEYFSCCLESDRYAQTVCQESILTVVIVALSGFRRASAGKEGPSP